MSVSMAREVALSNPCYLAEECANPAYGRRGPLGTIVLTVNAGYE